MVRDGFETGDGIPITVELINQIEREAEGMYQRGEMPNSDACPSGSSSADAITPGTGPLSRRPQYGGSGMVGCRYEARDDHHLRRS